MKLQRAIVSAAILLSAASLGCDVEDADLLEGEDIAERHTSWNFAFIRTHQPAWDLCMDVEGFGTTPGTLVNQYPCKSMTQSNFPHDQNQRFFLRSAGGSTFVIQSPLKIEEEGQQVFNCVDLMTPEFNGGNDDDLRTSEYQMGSHGLIMDRCDFSDPRQQWTLIEPESEEPIAFDEQWNGDFGTGEYHTYGRLQNAFTGECIDVPFGVDFKMPLQVHPCHTGPNQLWDIFQPLWFG
ncbi:MAG: RICIN domain-containing protein [Nannocystaceae bacterium]|nr:RICIN domain-containing protein [bacterium]